MARNNGYDVEAEVFERQATICKAFAHPTRLHLLDLLGKKERPLTEIQEALGVSRANLSQHLAVLKAARVITTYRVGKQVHAALAMPEVKQACLLIREVLRSQIRQQKQLPKV